MTVAPVAGTPNLQGDDDDANAATTTRNRHGQKRLPLPYAVNGERRVHNQNNLSNQGRRVGCSCRDKKKKEKKKQPRNIIERVQYQM